MMKCVFGPLATALLAAMPAAAQQETNTGSFTGSGNKLGGTVEGVGITIATDAIGMKVEPGWRNGPAIVMIDGDATRSLVTISFDRPIDQVGLLMGDYDLYNNGNLAPGRVATEYMTDFSIMPDEVGLGMEIRGGDVVPVVDDDQGFLLWTGLGGVDSLSFTHDRETPGLGVVFEVVAAEPVGGDGQDGDVGSESEAFAGGGGGEVSGGGGSVSGDGLGGGGTAFLTDDDIAIEQGSANEGAGGPFEIGIRWTTPGCDTIDLDLYLREGGQADWIYWRNVETPQGEYPEDIRDNARLAENVDGLERAGLYDVGALRDVQALVHFYDGACPGGVPGLIRARYDGAVYEMPFQIPAERGDKDTSPRNDPSGLDTWIVVPIETLFNLR